MYLNSAPSFDSFAVTKLRNKLCFIYANTKTDRNLRDIG